MERDSWFRKTLHCMKVSIATLAKQSTQLDHNQKILVGATAAGVGGVSYVVYWKYYKKLMLQRELHLTQKKLLHLEETLKTANFDNLSLERDLVILELVAGKKSLKSLQEIPENLRMKALMNKQSHWINEISARKNEMAQKELDLKIKILAL